MPRNHDQHNKRRKQPGPGAILILFPCLACMTLTACQTVKPYQKQYLNDHYLQTNALPVEKAENEADSYREGMIGGMDGKAGGGCGCN